MALHILPFTKLSGHLTFYLKSGSFLEKYFPRDALLFEQHINRYFYVYLSLFLCFVDQICKYLVQNMIQSFFNLYRNKALVQYSTFVRLDIHMMIII